MTILLSQIIAYILVYKYVGLFLVVFVGSFIVPLPLNELILAVSALTKEGFNPWYVFYISLISNMLADILGYYLARIYGHAIFEKLRIKKNEKFYKAEAYMKKYAYGTIFFSKIVGPFGPWTNFLAGLIGLPFSKYLLFNFLGNFVDVAIFTIAGYYLGENWQVFMKNTWILGIVAIVAFVGYLAYITFRKPKQKIL